MTRSSLRTLIDVRKIEKISKLIVLAAGLLLAFVVCGSATAGCSCMCYDGTVQAVCTSDFDIPPLCPQTACPYAPMSTAPATIPLTSPNANSCQEVQQCDRYGTCKWEPVCR
jgi:hypothetical protein